MKLIKLQFLPNQFMAPYYFIHILFIFKEEYPLM
jgi:hypothetical protein